MLLGVMVPQLSPDVRVSVRLTTPAKWFTATTVTVVVDELPASMGVGALVVTVKSLNWKIAEAV
jgi:hypothetical protein